MSLKRNSVAALSLSAAALIGIAGWESFSPKAYDDGVGVQTVGFGTTKIDGKPVKQGDTITPVRALQQLGKDADVYQQAMRHCIKVPMYQHEWDAYVSLTYNIGAGAFCRSTLVRRLNARDYSGACWEILRWNKAGGKVLRGLTKRRESEYNLCVGKT
jgi:lysozyme